MNNQHADIHDRTSDDHEQFEQRQLEYDRERQRRATSDLRGSEIAGMVDELIDEGIVTVNGAAKQLVHSPTGRAFKSRSALAHFHLGWEGGRSENK